VDGGPCVVNPQNIFDQSGGGAASRSQGSSPILVNKIDVKTRRAHTNRHSHTLGRAEDESPRFADTFHEETSTALKLLKLIQGDRSFQGICIF
jgi:hypothetical protein